MEISMANVISDETIEYVGILAKLELSDEEKEAAKKDMGPCATVYNPYGAGAPPLPAPQHICGKNPNGFSRSRIFFY